MAKKQEMDRANAKLEECKSEFLLTQMFQNKFFMWWVERQCEKFMDDRQIM